MQCIPIWNDYIYYPFGATMPMIDSKRSGKSNIRLDKSGTTAATRLEFDPQFADRGVVESTIPYFQTLRSSVSSFRGKRDVGDVVETPGAIIKMNAENNSKPRYDTGHPFNARREELYTSHRRVVIRGPLGAFYEGPLLAGVDIPSGYKNFGGSTWDSIVPPAIDLAKGTTAIAKCEPTRNPFSLNRAVTEAFRDFPEIPLKALVGSRSRHEAAQNLGSEYLNVVFGILPTVDDIVSLCKRVINFSHVLDQFQRDIGRPVRRTFAFPETTSYKSSSGKSSRIGDGYVVGPQARYNFWKDGVPYKYTTEETYTEKYWFAGAFEYYLDPLLEKLGPAGDFVAKADQVLGLGSSIHTLWQLAPWSWLVDWFFNIGDLISVSEKLANDSLVLRYGYLMRTSSYTNVATTSGMTPLSAGIPTSVSTTRRVTVKERVRSTPYGFGVSTNAFSEQQWAILAALGLTKAPKILF